MTTQHYQALAACVVHDALCGQRPDEARAWLRTDIAALWLAWLPGVNVDAVDELLKRRHAAWVQRWRA